MSLKAAEERAGKSAARVLGYWPLGRVQKGDLATVSVIFCILPKTTTQPGFVCVYEAYSPRNVARCPARFRRCLTHRNGVARRYFIVQLTLCSLSTNGRLSLI
jgi:hypothetical protein